MFYFDKLPDSLRYIRLWLTIEAGLLLYLENSTVFMPLISGSLVFTRHILNPETTEIKPVSGAKKGSEPPS